MPKQIEPRTKPARMIWLDCLRLMAGVSMVGLHASSDINGQPFPDFAAAERVGPVLFRAIVYTARTELFLIISLFLLVMSLDRRPRGYLETIREQVRRLLVPFVFWVFVYAFYRLIKAQYFGYADAIWSELAAPTSWIGYLVLGSVQYHMHFLPTLFGLVLLFPLYRIGVQYPVFGLVILLCLFTKREVDIWMWSNLRDMAGFDYVLRAVKILTYGGYGIVAASFYGIAKSATDDRMLRSIGILAIYSGGLIFGIKLVYSQKVIASGAWQYNYDPAYWADFLMPAILFAACLGFRGASWPAIISKLAPYSFGIYLAHPLFLDILEVWLWDAGLSPSAFVSAKVVAAIIATSCLVWVLKKIPLLAWTVGLGPLPSLRNLWKLRSVRDLSNL